MNSQLLAKRRSNSRSRQVKLAAIAVLLFRVTLDFAYVHYVDKFFGASLSAGVFRLTEINILRLLVSYVIVLMLGASIAAYFYRRGRPSGIVLLLYFIVAILPLSSLYGLTDAPASFFFVSIGSFAVLLVATGLLPGIKVHRLSRDLVYLGLTVVLGLSAYVYGWLVISGALGRFNLDLLEVYEVRTAYVEKLAPFMGYLVPWQASVINIIMFLYALWRRKPWLVGVAAAFQLFLFGMTGFKSFLLAPILAGGVYILWNKKHALTWILGGSALMILGAYAISLINDDPLMPSLLIRRLFFVPAALHFIYYDFFSQPENLFVMLSNSILAPFVQYPFEMSLPRVIAWAYWGRDFSPNVGYLGDAFAHFGFIGMFLFSIILGVFLRIMDSVGARLPANLVAAAIATPAMALTNSGLFTSLMTHGFLFAVLMIWMLRSLVTKTNQIRTSVSSEG